MVRLSIMHHVVQDEKAGKRDSNLFLMPDGIAHPQFETAKNNRGAYVPCWKAAFEHLLRQGTVLLQPAGGIV